MASSNGIKQRATLAVVVEKIDNLTRLVQQHVEADEQRFVELHHLLEGPGDKPGLKGRLNLLEASEARRTWHIRALWGAALAGVASWFAGN